MPPPDRTPRLVAHDHRHALRPGGWRTRALATPPPYAAAGLFAFADRREAGRILAEWLGPLPGSDTTIVAIAGGGVPVAAEVARAGRVPLRAIVVEPIRLPGRRCFDLGAIARDGTTVVDEELARRLRVAQAEVDAAVARCRDIVEARARAYGRGAAPHVGGRHAVLVDEALGTGHVALAAVASLRHAGARSVRVAVPLGARAVVRRVAREADDVVAVLAPFHTGPARGWYRSLPAVPDADAEQILRPG
jgi:predicted phosphoribosyltransferase